VAPRAPRIKVVLYREVCCLGTDTNLNMANHYAFMVKMLNTRLYKTGLGLRFKKPRGKTLWVTRLKKFGLNRIYWYLIGFILDELDKQTIMFCS
jgi:hypothetical protein